MSWSFAILLFLNMCLFTGIFVWFSSVLSKIRDDVTAIRTESDLVKFLMHEKSILEAKYRDLNDVYRGGPQRTSLDIMPRGQK